MKVVSLSSEDSSQYTTGILPEESNIVNAVIVKNFIWKSQAMCLGGNTCECSESGKSFFSNHICYTLGYSLRGGTLPLQLVQKSQEKSHLIVHKNFMNFVIMIAFSRKSKLFDHLYRREILQMLWMWYSLPN